MEITSFKSLSKWLTAIGIKTAAELAEFKKGTDGTVRDLLNKANSYFCCDVNLVTEE